MITITKENLKTMMKVSLHDRYKGMELKMALLKTDYNDVIVAHYKGNYYIKELDTMDLTKVGSFEKLSAMLMEYTTKVEIPKTMAFTKIWIEDNQTELEALNEKVLKF